MATSEPDSEPDSEAGRRQLPLVVYADGVHTAHVAPLDAAARAGHDAAEVLVGWTPEPRDWLASPDLAGSAFLAGYALAGAVADGRLRYRPMRLSAVPPLLERLRPEVAVVPGLRRGGELVFRGTAGIGPAAARAAAAVVVEVDTAAAEIAGPPIEGEIVAVVERSAAGPLNATRPAPPRGCDEVDLAVGRNVASILPDEPTLQLGPGTIAEAIVRSVDRPVHLWSGLLTDAMAELDARGLLLGTVTAGYTWGAEPIAGLARAGRLTLAPVEVTHDISAVARIPRFVACNTALQLGLDGSVNVERIGDRIVAGIGGHADFSAAGSACVDGLSVVALRSTTRSGASTVVARVDVVSTPRCDVDVVVTEHGVADLRGRDDGERANRVLSVAAPEHRSALAAGR